MSTCCVAFLSDYGHRDPCVGVCHGVIKRVESEIPVIDLSHGIPAQDIRAGAIALADCTPFVPRKSVVLAVVDPGVGGHRRAVAVKTFDGMTFVGPDNGLMAPAIALSGGAEHVAEISDSPWRLEPVSRTFHGRDIFAPVAATIATGAPISEAGQPLDPSVLIGLELAGPTVGEGTLETEAIDIDIFGNVRLAATADDLAAAGVEFGGPVEIDAAGLRVPARFVHAFADVEPQEPLVFEDSNGSLAVALNQGHAGSKLGIKRGAQVRILAS
ncbi:MAG TPA: SAM-dependent chlorinase/fluorinase [Solirubrobacterales bacterium]|nr:SAM-dependent chlorinase/fluorinase [Solirubrobacterales bacterium]